MLYGLKNIGITFVRNGGDKTLPGLVSLSFEGYEGETILHRLDLMGFVFLPVLNVMVEALRYLMCLRQ